MNSVAEQIQQQITIIDQKIATSKDLVSDPDLGLLAQEELVTLESQKQALQTSLDSLQQTYSPKQVHNDIDPNHASFEIRPGAGGEEAKIWADDLLRMYLRFSELKKYKLEVLDGGMTKISGRNVYNIFKYESGVHRVQRVPATEAQGRVHTSTASIAVLPIISPKALEIRDEELEWQFTRSGGAGGQNVNKVNTAVRLTHKPSGIMVHCSRERTQIRNREIALEMLRSQLWEIEEEKRLGSLENQRKAAVGRAMRAEKIRTYNYPQNRLTDHRINKSWYNLDMILEGDLQDVLETVSANIGKELPTAGNESELELD